MEVPKFGSFKPRKKTVSDVKEASPLKDAQTKSEHNTSHRVKKHGDNESHHRQREKDQSYERRRRDHRDDRSSSQKRQSNSQQNHRHKVRDDEPSLKKEAFPADDKSLATTQQELHESDLFIIDRRGDAKNVEYGSLHRYSVPAYRRTGYGNLIGRSLSTKIDRDNSNEKEICLIDAVRGKRLNQKTTRLLSSKYGRSSETRLKFVSAMGPDLEDGKENDFIELSSARKRKRGAESPEVDGGVDYRSIEGKAKASNKPADEDVEYASESDGAEHSSLDLRARQESAALSKKAKASPLVLDSWLALADHQSQLIRPGTDPAMFTTSERGTLAELQLSILNEAGRTISAGKPGRERLLLATMDAGTPLWDKTKLAARWKDVLKECPTSIFIWTRYMDFVQYDHSSFQYEICKDAYLKWLQVLKAAHETSTGEEKGQVSKVQTYALLRFTAFVRDAGYDEFAIAIWQVLLELHFLAPKETEQSSLEARLESLEDYWDIETPRVGENSTLTWAGFHELGPSNATIRTPVQLPQIHIDPRTPFASFAMEEANLANVFMLPASTENEDAITDPFRCIMFEDLRSVVECLSMQLPREGLISAFLHYVGLPPIPGMYLDAQDWSVDPCLNWASDSVKTPAQGHTTFILFESAFQTFHRHHGSTNDGLARFIDRTLDSLLQKEQDEDDSIRVYYLAFKAKMFPQEAPKVAKKLLKTRSTSLRLYNAFALIEARAERMNKALGVWNAALGMLPRLDSNTQDDAVLLWHSRLLMQLDQSDDVGALETLLTIYDSGKSSRSEHDQDTGHIAQLRLRRELESGFDHTMLSGKTSHAVLHADLLTWLTYLTQDVTNAISTYNVHIAALTRSGTLAALEELQQCKSRLLTVHIDRQRTYKPAQFQHEIAEALQHFPNNSLLLDLHSRIASQDRLRSLVTEQKRSDLSDLSIVQWSFKLHAEMERVADMSSGGGTVNTVRATFAKALLTPGSTVAHSFTLWSAWLAFEIGRGDDRRRARNVFLDGLRALPGVKAWAILGMKEGLLEEAEMRRIWEGMVEKGLRIRVGVEEFV